VRSSVYAASVWRLREGYGGIVEACRRRGISRLAMAVATTGKLMGKPDEMRLWKERLQGDGFQVFALNYAVGHPAMEKYYNQDGAPPDESLLYDGPMVLVDPDERIRLLPRGWQYAVNEFGNPVYCSACPNEACVDGNREIMRVAAALFDEVWHDDDFRTDGDQGAGLPQRSTASCYCDRCMEELSGRLGRTIAREDVLSDQALHGAWVEMKTDALAALWKAVCDAGRQVNPRLASGLMIRWGGEERDGIDVPKLLPDFGAHVLFRAGEGHFGQEEYSRPENAAIEHLVSSYHVSWFPKEAHVLSETTYVGPMSRENVFKKAALSIAAGTGEVSYCPCVADWIKLQDFVEEDKDSLARIAETFADKAAMYRPVAIVRSPAAGAGDRRPVQRVRDRQPFPLLGMAGIFSTVVRQGGWRDDGSHDLLAVTGRTVWDYTLDWARGRERILDGHALLESSPLNEEVGIANAVRGSDGRVDFTGDGYSADGLLLVRDGVIVIPYTWQDVHGDLLARLLEDIRRVVGPKVRSVVVEGDLLVMPVHYRLPDEDAIMLVNLSQEERDVALRLKGDRQGLVDIEGRPTAGEVHLSADEVRVLLAR
jgi:hypothetical protein